MPGTYAQPVRRWGVLRRAVALLLLVSVAAACGSGDDPTLELPGQTTTTTGAGTGVTDPSDGERSGTATAPPSQTRGAGDASAGAGPPPAQQEPAAEEPSGGWPELDGSGQPGSFAPAVLRPDQSERVEVRVSSQAGREPRRQTIDHLSAVLRDVTGGKEVVVTGGPPVPARERWTSDDLRRAAGPVDQGDGTAVIRLLFVGGSFADSEGVIGVTVQGDAAAIFSDDVDRSGSPLVGSAAIEDAVTMHELGHILGLVDLYLSTGREDPEHPGHSRSRGSVMYWAVESTLVSDVLTGGPPRDFDADDLADLARIRRGA